MQNDLWLIGGLGTIMGLVLLMPFLSKRVEEDLEAFLLIMGIFSVSVSKLWSWHLLHEAVLDPIKITLAVLIAGFLFRLVRPKLHNWTSAIAKRFGYGALMFLVVVVLGLLSSVITAIIAALVLVEIVSAMKLHRKTEVRIVIIACFAIGLGAVLTPLGEPLATIAIAKLKGPPHNADFFFLFRMLAVWIIPPVLALGILATFLEKKIIKQTELKEDKPENLKDIFVRTFKVYIFVFALVLLGTGFTPLVERYLVNASPKALFWVNIISAILDNATLTAAEISPNMPAATIQCILMGLLIAGGMLIPGNIPNIICANKLSIKSKEWAVYGAPLGLAIMIIFFIIILFVL
jgi:predicted cation transporter